MSHWRRHFSKGGTLAWSWGNCFAMLGVLCIIAAVVLLGGYLLVRGWFALL